MSEPCDFDDAWIQQGELVVRGHAPADQRVRLTPRRYKSRPAWATVDVVTDAVEPGDASLSSGRPSPGDEFRVTCPAEEVWGTRGIVVAGRTHRRVLPVTPATGGATGADHPTGT